MQLITAEHNAEYPTNGCDTPDTSILISGAGEDLEFIIDGKVNPDVVVPKGSCLEITFDNTSDLDHDFTVVDDSVSVEDEFFEIVFMEAELIC